MANSDLIAQYKSGMSQDYVNQLAKQYGVTPDQVYAIYASQSNPFLNTNANPNYASQGVESGPTFGTLSLLKTLGITGGGGQQQQQGPTNIGGVSTSAKDLATNLGAQALGMHAIYNPTPEEASSVTGVGKVAKPTESDVVPSVAGDAWQQVGTSAGLSQSDIDQFKAQGLSASNVAKKFGVSAPTSSPWTTTPGIFTQAPRLAPQGTQGQAVTPTPQATAAQVGTPAPFAIAPAAPGIQIPQEAHTSALANAGMALFAHFGGDPNSASPEEINNFHSQLMNGIQSVAGNAAPQGAPAQGGAPVKEPVKMATGGIVPGEGDEDVIPAMLTPGELVIPKKRVKQLADQGTSNAPKTPPSAPGSGVDSDTLNQLAAAKIMRQNAALSANTPAYPTATTPAAQGYAAAANAGQVGGTAPSAATVQGAAAMTPAQTQSSIAAAKPAAAAGAISGLASGLSAAAQAYADSIKPWQVQASHIPNPDEFRNRYQATTFGQSLA